MDADIVVGTGNYILCEGDDWAQWVWVQGVLDKEEEIEESAQTVLSYCYGQVRVWVSDTDWGEPVPADNIH